MLPVQENAVNLEMQNGRSEAKDFSPATRHAPLGGCPESSYLCRGQGLGRTARRPHHIDLKTGMYCGRQVLKPRKVDV
jgi:hypothetical protein